MPDAVRTTLVGRGANAVEVVHDSERCFGFLRSDRHGWKAWWSSVDRFEDHYVGAFATRAAAIAAAVNGGAA